MKKDSKWRIRAGAFVVTALCLGSGAALAAGGADDPLVTLSYLNETALPQLIQSVQTNADARQKALAEQFRQIAAQGDGGSSASASYTVVTLAPGQRMNLELGAEVMLRVGSAAAGAAENPALVDMTTGGGLNHGEALVQNHLYLATMTDHYITAGSGTVKVLARGGYTLS